MFLSRRAAVAEESSPFSNHPFGGAQHVRSVCAPGERSGAARPGFRAQGGLFYLDGVSREGDWALSCTSLRAGPRMSSPARAAPPPTAITSGLKVFTNPARPIPSHRPV